MRLADAPLPRESSRSCDRPAGPRHPLTKIEGEDPPPSTTTRLRTVLVVLRELGIDVRDGRERDRLRRVDLPDRGSGHADLLLARRSVAERFAQAAGVDALQVLKGLREPLAREVAQLDGLLGAAAGAQAASTTARVSKRARPTSPRTPHRIRAEKRSEEHTSELQSRGHLVCRLLLEKKNKT